MKKTAIICASYDGHTRSICQTLQAQLARQGHVDTALLDVAHCNAQTISDYDVLIFASAIRYGKHLKSMVRYLRSHQAALASKKTAFFSVNLTARKPHRNTPETSNYIRKMLDKLDWQPDEVDVFAGKLNYPHYRFFDKHIIRFIMWLTGGPTDTNAVTVFTDWQRVEAFGLRLDKLMEEDKKSC